VTLDGDNLRPTGDLFLLYYDVLARIVVLTVAPFRCTPISTNIPYPKVKRLETQGPICTLQPMLDETSVHPIWIVVSSIDTVGVFTTVKTDKKGWSRGPLLGAQKLARKSAASPR
jgi:hypothetical protein